MNSKMREEFEAAYKAACLGRAIPRFDPAIFTKDRHDEYLNSLVQSAWWGFKTGYRCALPTSEPQTERDVCKHCIFIAGFFTASALSILYVGYFM